MTRPDKFLALSRSIRFDSNNPSYIHNGSVYDRYNCTVEEFLQGGSCLRIALLEAVSFEPGYR